jgi:ribosome maturation protein Sdo1
MKTSNIEKALREIRQRIFDYPEHKQEQADRVLRKLKTKLLVRRGGLGGNDYHPFYAAEGWF